MKSQRKWLFVGGVAVAVAVALALGVSINTLLLFGAALLCPAAMYFGMGGMRQGCGHGETCRQAETKAVSAPEGKEFQSARNDRGSAADDCCAGAEPAQSERCVAAPRTLRGERGVVGPDFLRSGAGHHESPAH